MIKVSYDTEKDVALLEIHNALILGRGEEGLFSYAEKGEEEMKLISEKLRTEVTNNWFYKIPKKFKGKVKTTIFLLQYVWRTPK